MSAHTTFIAIVISVVVAIVFGAPASVSADNSYKLVAYNIPADSSDPQSDIVFRVLFELSEADRDNDNVGWQIDTAIFEQIVPNDDSNFWKTDSVTVPTSDGLWWVHHSKPDEPEYAEFDLPPELSGDASPQNPQISTQIIYYFGGVYGPHGPDKSRVKYSFTQEGNEDPELENDDTFVFIDLDPINPGVMVGAIAAPSISATTSDLDMLLEALDTGCVGASETEGSAPIESGPSGKRADPRLDIVISVETPADVTVLSSGAGGKSPADDLRLRE